MSSSSSGSGGLRLAVGNDYRHLPPHMRQLSRCRTQYKAHDWRLFAKVVAGTSGGCGGRGRFERTKVLGIVGCYRGGWVAHQAVHHTVANGPPCRSRTAVVLARGRKLPSLGRVDELT